MQLCKINCITPIPDNQPVMDSSYSTHSIITDLHPPPLPVPSHYVHDVSLNGVPPQSVPADTGYCPSTLYKFETVN